MSWSPQQEEIEERIESRSSGLASVPLSFGSQCIQLQTTVVFFFLGQNDKVHILVQKVYGQKTTRRELNSRGAEANL